MKDVEAELIGYRSRGAEMLLTFAIQRDDLPRVKDMVEMIGHCFELDIRHIDYDNPQPAQEGNLTRQSARAEPHTRVGIPDAQAKLYARIGILSNDPEFWNWARDRYGITADITEEEVAAYAIRTACDVTSRREIKIGTRNELAFNLLESAFRESNLRKA